MSDFKWSVIAKRMATIGLLPIPCKKNKDSLVKWKELGLSNLNEAYFNVFDNRDKVHGIAIVAGSRSGSLECIDVDCKYDLTGDLFDNVLNNIVEYSHELYNKLVIAQTPSGGYHILYRTNVQRRNMKLARRMTTEQEMDQEIEQAKIDGRDHKGLRPHPQVLIETRGEGGYFLGWPSPGYEWVKGNYADIQMISDEESNTIIEICKAFDQISEQKPIEQAVEEASKGGTVTEFNNQRTQKLVERADKPSKYITTPWDDYNQRGDIVELLVGAGWKVVRSIPSPDDGRLVVYLKRPGVSDKDVSATFNHVPGKLYCFSSSTNLPQNLPLNPFEVLLHNSFSGNVKEAVQHIVGLGYGVLKHKASSDQAKDELVPAGKRTNMDTIMSRSATHIRGEVLETWWGVNIVQRKDGEIRKEITVHQHKFIKWLGGRGLRCRQSGDKYDYIMVDGIICEYYTKKQVADHVLAWIGTLPSRFDFIDRDDLAEQFIRGSETYLSDIRLSMVKVFDDDMVMRDTMDESYIAFENGVAVISKYGIKMTSYSKFHRYVWRDQIKKFKFDPPAEGIMDTFVFSQFLFNVAGRELDRYHNLLAMLGYSMVTFKDPAIPAAVILCDSKVTENSEGGTGKGLLVKAMSYIRNTVYEDGKMANKRNQSEFRFSRITPSTEILHISDVEKGFDFEAMFSLLTEGIPVNKKYKAEEFIPYEKTPKIVISTNYTVGGRGSSHDRRRIEFELADHYNARRTPYSEFGHHFFDGWNEDQWNIFYGVMARCVQFYLQNGIPSFVGINIDLRKFRDETSGEFVSWFFTKFGSKSEVEETGPRIFGKVHFSALYNEYLTYSGLERHETRPQRFLKYVASGCSYVGLELREDSSRKTSYDPWERYLIITDPSKPHITLPVEKLVNQKTDN
jgi:hypothetical protein